MPTYVSPFTGTVVTPTDVSYLSLPFSTDQSLAWPAEVNPPENPAARIIDCVASTNGLTITLPLANQGATGTDILFRNLGVNAFTIKDAEGGQSLTVSSGIAKYVYLADNTTAAGVWENITFGAGTSYADATTLAGYGLTTSNGKLVVTQNIITVSATPTITDANRASTYAWNGGVGTLTLPVPGTLSTGWYIGFRNNGTGSLTIAPPSPALINNEAAILANPGDSGFIMYDVSSGGYITVGWVAPTNTVFSAATYDVDAVVGNTLSLVFNAPIIQTYIAQSDTRTATLAVTLPPITQIYVLANNTGHTDYNITFQNQGSSQTPYVLTDGSVVIMLSDGNFLYPLTEQSSTTLFYGANGSQAIPSFSFLSDTGTGMYLVGSNVLGLTANSTQIMKLDGSNPLAPKVTVTAELVASLIDGGTF